MRKATGIAERRSRLSPVKLALLEKRLKGDFKEPLKSSAIEKRPDQATFPLSFAQERFWFLDQLEPDSPVYNRPMGLRLKGALDVSALERAMNAILGRHDVLRANFSAIKGRPIQSIAPTMSLSLDVVDLSDLDVADRENESLRLSVEEALRPFELAKDPLLRAMLFRLAMEDYILLVVMHHIVCDGWSAKVFTKELSVLYEAFSTGTTSPLPELPIQCADHAFWQRQRFQGEVFNRQVSYWRDILSDSPSLLDLPTDRPRQSYQTFCGANQTIMISSSLLELLKALSRKEDVTLFMTLLAAFKVLLYRYTGQMDIVVGSPIAGRSYIEAEDLIGFFVNTLVLRTDLSGNPSFRQLLQRIREITIGAYEHGDLPFEKLVEVVKPEREPSRNPVFQVFFNFENVPEKNINLPKLSISEFEFDSGMAAFDLSVEILEKKEELYCLVNYNTDIFESLTITRMAGHYQTLLESIVTNPDQCISALSLLTGAMRQKLSTKGNTIQPTKSFANFKAAEIDQSLQSRFMQQVKSYPHNIAVKSEKYEWTYEELNLEGNRIAKRVLTECGDKEERIALLFGHDAPMIASLFGALKAGKTYVPLDPSYPVERLAYILEDSNACAVLTDSINVDLAEALTREKVQLINIDDKQSAQTFENVEVSITPDALAYILYTSGSTGLPKGVMQSHRNAMHFIRVYTNNLHISEDDRLTLISSYSFDGAIMDIFGALLNGSTLYPIDIKEETSESNLQWLIDQEITLYHSTPTVYRYLLSSLDRQKKFPKIRLVVLGGEEVFRQDVELYKKHFEPDCIFINGLGPSESTVTLQYLINGHTEIRRTAVPVGYPVEETEILLLNDAGEDAEVYGEISIRSPHIALGYWQKPELTNKVFLPDPEGGNKRIYRSGDMGRLLPDGGIEFAGRKDFQVKIRGIRIEVGEIEVVLGQHPAVGEVVVVPGEDSHGDRQLIAYLVINENLSPSISELRGFLKQKLPEYMIPSAFVFLDALTRTPNGKVDRRALPEPDKVRQESAETFVAPRNNLELQLTKIWEKVLGIKNVGIKDNFFDLGGHSLLAVRLFALIRKKFSNDLPLAILFQAPTVEQLSKIVSEGIQPTSWTSLVPMQTEGSNPPFFCVPQAGSTVYSLSNFVRHLGTKQPFYGLQPLGIDGENSPHTRIEDMAAHYIEEIKSVQPQGPYLLGGRCFGSEVAFEIAQQLYAQGEEVALLAILGDNFIPAWARKGVESSNSALSLTHSFQRTIYYLRHSSLGDVFRTAVSEVNIRVNPYLRDTKRVLKAQLWARANYIRKPYPGRVTLFASRSSSHPGYREWTLAGLAEGGVDLQKIPRVYDRLLDEPHVQVVAAKLIACINKALDERFTTKPYTRQAPVAQARKKNGDSTRQVSGIGNSTWSTYADARPTDPGTRLNLSLVLPCYNEGPHFSDNIEEILQALDAAELEYEIILIDDRSTDETAQQIRSYLSGQHKRNIRAYYHDTNLGRGATVAEGIRRANSTYVGFIDIDLETPPQFIPAALDALVSDSADMVLGNRKIGRVLESPLRLVMSSVYRWLVSRLLKTDSLDTEAGFKFFRRDLILPVLDEVQNSHWFWDTEITVLAQAKGLRIYSLPVTFSRDLTKQPTIRPFHDSWRSFASLLAFAKRHRFARHDVTHKTTP